MESIKAKEAFLLKQSTYIKEARQKSREKWLNQNRNLPTSIMGTKKTPSHSKPETSPQTQQQKVCLLNDSNQSPPQKKFTKDTF